MDTAIEELALAIDQALGQGPQRFVFDLSTLSCVDDRIAGAIVGALMRLRERGGRVTLTGLRGQTLLLIRKMLPN